MSSSVSPVSGRLTKNQSSSDPNMDIRAALNPYFYN